jgi:Flp pilus assembly protein TadG
MWRVHCCGRFGRVGDDQGAAAVEFALLVPLVLLILFGVIDFGRAFNIQETLTQAAREGVRGYALGLTADPTSATQNAAVGVSGITITYGTQATAGGADSAGGTCSSTGAQNVWVQAQTPYTFIPFLGLGSTTITGKAYMRCGG